MEASREVARRWLVKSIGIMLCVAVAAATLGLTLPALLHSEKRVWVIAPGRIIRGAWQDPRALQTIIERERIKTIVTLTAINRDDEKYVAQSRVVERMGVDWVIVPMHGSRGTLEQLASASDLVADAARQPVFFHCVAGHHRSSQVHAAYLIRHRGFTAPAAWKVVSELPWARPDAKSDEADRELIAAFASYQASINSRHEISRREGNDEDSPEIAGSTGGEAIRFDRTVGGSLCRLGSGKL